VALLVATVTILAAGRAGAGSGAEEQPEPLQREHVVRSGETLWEIASRLAAPGEDPRPLIGEIRRANDLSDSALREGQRLLLP